MLYNGFDQRVQLTRGTGTSAVTRRLVSDRDGRLLGVYGGAANGTGAALFTEYVWLLPEASDGEGTFGGDDGTGGWTALAVVTANGTAGTATETLHTIHSTHLGVPVGTYNASAAATTPPPEPPCSASPLVVQRTQTTARCCKVLTPPVNNFVTGTRHGFVGWNHPFSYAAELSICVRRHSGAVDCPTAGIRPIAKGLSSEDLPNG